jgi:hypothetical protein
MFTPNIDIREVDAANFSLQTTRLGLYILYTPSGLNSTGGGAHDSAAKAQGWVSHFSHSTSMRPCHGLAAITYM